VAGTVACDTDTACGVGQQCCYTSSTSQGECQNAAPVGTTCATAENLFELDCDGPNDCSNGNICCNIAFMRFITTCLPPGDCTGTGASVVCNHSLGAQNNPACANGQTCTVLSTLPSLARCVSP
jgi:hypothetical protein